MRTTQSRKYLSQRNRKKAFYPLCKVIASIRNTVDEVIILLGTGLRVSELCGLTETDLDFENRIINVDHQLLRSAETGYYIEKPKTESGIRQIPMSEKVYEALGRVVGEPQGIEADHD